MEKQCKERREWSDKATGKKLELAALTGVEGTTGNGTQAKPIKGKGRPVYQTVYAAWSPDSRTSQIWHRFWDMSIDVL